MTSAAPVYRKLPGRGLAFAGIGRLWLAEDHLLEVESLLLHERYRRFFLPDIAALVVRRTKVRLIWNLVHGVLGFGGAALAGGLWWSGTFVQDQDPRVMLWVFAGMVAPFAVFFIVLFFINTFHCFYFLRLIYCFKFSTYNSNALIPFAVILQVVNG